MSAPIRLIVGLGNPGRDYAETRHNVGFMVLARLAERLGATWKADKARKGELAAAPGALLVRPKTFMNLSGECVGPLMRYYKYEPEQVLVIYDDIAFPTGTLKLRTSGSAGGHNGVKSLIAHLGSERFPRIRVGIGLPGQKNMVGHVLGKLSPEERPAFESALNRAADAALCALREGFAAAANRYNTKKTPPFPPAAPQAPQNTATA
ncbi:MAG: aminoacyl-tRNA hydrolase [Akkermansia sp.]